MTRYYSLGVPTSQGAGRDYEVWYLVNPASGANNLEMTWPTQITNNLSSVFYQNVNQANPLGNHATNAVQSSATTYTSNITSTAPYSLMSDYLFLTGLGTTRAAGSHGHRRRPNLGMGTRRSAALTTSMGTISSAGPLSGTAVSLTLHFQRQQQLLLPPRSPWRSWLLGARAPGTPTSTVTAEPHANAKRNVHLHADRQPQQLA